MPHFFTCLQGEGSTTAISKLKYIGFKSPSSCSYIILALILFISYKFKLGWTQRRSLKFNWTDLQFFIESNTMPILKRFRITLLWISSVGPFKEINKRWTEIRHQFESSLKISWVWTTLEKIFKAATVTSDEAEDTLCQQRNIIMRKKFIKK